MSVNSACGFAKTNPKPKFFNPRRLGHVNLFVSDLDRSMKFYNRFVGLEEVYRTPLARGGFLSNGNTHHDVGLTEVSGPLGTGASPGLFHFAFELENETDLVSGYEAAIAAGVKFAFSADHDIAHAVYGKDPDGNLYEMYADVVRDWRRQRSGTVTKPKPAWVPRSTPPCDTKNYHEHPEIRRVSDAIFHPVRTTHVTLVAHNYQAMFHHFTEVVGLSPLLGDTDTEFALLGGTCGEISLSLLKCNGEEPTGLHHVGLQVDSDSDLESSLLNLSARGFIPELVYDHKIRRIVFLRDPDGTRLQFYANKSATIAEFSALSRDTAALIS